MRILTLFVLLFGLACSSGEEKTSIRSEKALSDANDYSADVLVFGATPGGLIAAIAAKRSGRSVRILEPSNELGGIIVGGLGASDTCRIHAIGSTAREFFMRVGQEYGIDVRWFVEPKVAKKVFEDMLSDTGLEVEYQQRLAGVEKDGRRITNILTEDGRAHSARVFIDATYEGDLLAKAGVSYTVGRESREQYGETMAGATDPSPLRNFRAPVSAYYEDGSLVPGVHATSLPEVGTADKKVMGFNFRFCLTRIEGNIAPIPEPEKYDRSQFELLARYFEAMPTLTFDDVIMFHDMYEGKHCTNRQGPFSTNLTGGSWDWAEASYEEREEIFKRHKEYTLGFLHFLRTDDAVPKEVRETMKLFGFCKDEFVDTDNFPHALYVREGRRMIGEYVLREQDLLEDRFKDDGIGLASCPIEVHAVQRVVRPDGTVANEGLVGKRVEPYAIPYRSVIPKKDEVDNLLVPVAVSASQIAYSSMRMEPVFMILGHSTGVAAAMAVEDDIAVQAVDTDALRTRLKSHKQVL